jgi:hypothetical protein
VHASVGPWRCTRGLFHHRRGTALIDTALSYIECSQAWGEFREEYAGALAVARTAVRLVIEDSGTAEYKSPDGYGN